MRTDTGPPTCKLNQKKKGAWTHVCAHQHGPTHSVAFLAQAKLAAAFPHPPHSSRNCYGSRAWSGGGSAAGTGASPLQQGGAPGAPIGADDHELRREEDRYWSLLQPASACAYATLHRTSGRAVLRKTVYCTNGKNKNSGKCTFYLVKIGNFSARGV